MSSTTVQIPTEQIMEPAATTPTSQSTTATLESESFASSFTLFPKLPIELRLRIWRTFDNSTPRDVQVTITTPSETSLIEKTPTFKSLRPIPLILHICKESRTEGLKVYKKVFKVKDKMGVEREEIYFNPEREMLFVRVPRWTPDWRTYTGGHPHLSNPSPTAPLDPLNHNIFRCQIENPMSCNPKGGSEIIVVVEPTKTPMAVASDERVRTDFVALRRVAGDAWQCVEFYVWKAEWWHEHWEFLFTEVMKEEVPKKQKRGRKRAPLTGRSRRNAR